MLHLQNNSWAHIALQLVGTVTILLFVPSDLLKLCLFLLLWFPAFYPLSRRELIAFILLSVGMTIIDIIVVARGVFAFTTTPFFGIPFFEIVLWGFYFLHWTRLYEKMRTTASSKRLVPASILMVALAIILYIAQTHDDRLLYIGMFFACIVVFFHTKDDWFMYTYGAFTGLIIELAGVLSGQWYYTGDFIGLLGVPIWQFITWAIISWLTGQILYPILRRERS